MRRYDEDQTLAARLERGELQRRDMVEVGCILARFHEDTRRLAPGGAGFFASLWLADQVATLARSFCGVRCANATAVEWVNTSWGQRAVLGSARDVFSCTSRPTGP